MSLSPKPKLLCDENVPAKVKESLALEGFDVKMPIPRSLDEDVAKLAKSEGRVLVTFDRHFANTLLFPPVEYTGILFVRISPPLVKAVLDALLSLLSSVNEFEGKLFVLSETGFRLFPKR
ncbi:DUF5615 family PIN-like protein [Candidatus Woesearchaeota archaeon]|nr:DUF5615 family PIN-like protein [Candidatus Woesearchaeota archaeon]